MMLVELTTIPSGALPVTSFRDHMRLGTGFGDEGLQDLVLEGFLRAAIAAIEARTGKILLTREFSWTLTSWRDPKRQPLPLAPVSAVLGLSDIDALGNETALPVSWYLDRDDHRPSIVAKSACLPSIPESHSMRLELVAGFGQQWSDLPPDLAQAVFMLAAHFYEFRQEAATVDQMMPFGVLSLIERYRTVRVFLGGGGS